MSPLRPGRHHADNSIYMTDVDRSLKESDFAQAVLGVLFSLTFSEALGHVFANLSAYPTVRAVWDSFLARPLDLSLRVAQLLAFLLTLSRFYLGAFRFLTLGPRRTHRAEVWEIIWNVVNVSLLFVGFYLAALLVTKRGMFLFFIFLLHASDFLWFGVGRRLLNRTNSGSRIGWWFLVFDGVTMLAAAVVGLWFLYRPFNTMWFPVWTTLLLVGMFVADVLGFCRNFYFDPARWREHSDRWTARRA